MQGVSAEKTICWLLIFSSESVSGHKESL